MMKGGAFECSIECHSGPLDRFEKEHDHEQDVSAEDTEMDEQENL
jgi:hypothetical protein